MGKKILLTISIFMILTVLAGCARPAPANVVFTATIEEIHGASLLVRTTDAVSFDRASVSFDAGMAQPSFSFAVGQKVRVTILPQIAESYPVQVKAVAVELVSQPEPTSGASHPDYSAFFFRADSMAEGGFDFLIANARNADTMVISSVRHIPLVVIDSADALAQFMREAGAYYQVEVSYGENGSLSGGAAKYDEAFFGEKLLLILGTQEASGSVRHEIAEVSASGNALSVSVRTITPEMGTTDMADWFIFVELSSADTESVSAFDAYYE